MDGGLLNPLPIAVAQRQPDELLVAVNVNSSIPPLVLPEPTDQEILARKIGKSRWDSFVSSILRIDTRSNDTSERIGMFGLLNRSFDLLQDRLTQVMLETYKPDILVNVSRNSCGSFEFYRASELIEVGRLSFESAFAEFERAEAGVVGG
ncbi:hypothetical protein D3C80_1107520 [compost metagenome]